MTERSYAFVYGTLKKDHGNHTVMHTDTETPEFVGEAVTTGKYYMTTVGFPYVIEPQDLTEEKEILPVVGELYSVTDDMVQNMDWLEGYRGEGHNNHYNRKYITVETEDGKQYETAVYLYNSDDHCRAQDLPCVGTTEFMGQKVYQY